MRIGIDVRVADPTEPGQQRYLWRLGGFFASKGHEVRYLTVKRQRDGARAPDGTSLELMAGLGRAELRRRVTGLGLDCLLLNPERSRRYRGVHANVLRSAYGTEHYRQKLRSFRNPVDRALRSGLRVAPWVLAERSWERAFYESPDPPPRVIAQSRYMKSEILASYRIPESNVHVVHNAVDTDEFTPARRLSLREEMRARWGVPRESLCLLFLGHNFRLKGLWQLLRILGGSSNDRVDAHLLVVGRGTGRGQRARARRLIRHYGLERSVTLAGPVRPSLHALAAADALVHLSWHDSFGFVGLEAMACGLPVVTTEWTGVSEIIEDGTSGVLVDPTSDTAIRRGIAKLTGEATRARLGEAAAEVAARHSEPRNFEEVLRVFELAAAERS